MEAIITKRLPLQFDEKGNSLIAFDFKQLHQEYSQFTINRSSEVITVTESHIYVTYRALEKAADLESENEIEVYSA